jgi:hypothetical protein
VGNLFINSTRCAFDPAVQTDAIRTLPGQASFIVHLASFGEVKIAIYIIEYNKVITQLRPTRLHSDEPLFM